MHPLMADPAGRQCLLQLILLLLREPMLHPRLHSPAEARLQLLRMTGAVVHGNAIAEALVTRSSTVPSFTSTRSKPAPAKAPSVG